MTATDTGDAQIAPFEIRSVPARLALWRLVLAVVVTAALVLSSVATTLILLRAGFGVGSAAVVGVLDLGMSLYFFGAESQLLATYLTRDRGRRVVASRLDARGWHLAVEGVCIPWSRMAVEISPAETGYRVEVRFSGPLRRSWTPLARQTAWGLRRQRSFTLPMTAANPTAAELAAAIQVQSGGRVHVEWR